MKILMPLLITAPTMIQGTLALRARRGGSGQQLRRIKIGVVFNVCYLAAVTIAALMLSYV